MTLSLQSGIGLFSKWKRIQFYSFDVIIDAVVGKHEWITGRSISLKEGTKCSLAIFAFGVSQPALITAPSPGTTCKAYLGSLSPCGTVGNQTPLLQWILSLWCIAEINNEWVSLATPLWDSRNLGWVLFLRGPRASALLCYRTAQTLALLLRRGLLPVLSMCCANAQVQTLLCIVGEPRCSLLPG